MSKCDNCPNNCCGNNFVGLANAFKYSNGDLFNQILLSEEELEDIVNNYGDEYIEYIDNMPFISLNKDRSCKAFKNGKCSIYKSRPDVLQSLPIKIVSLLFEVLKNESQTPCWRLALVGYTLFRNASVSTPS